MALTVNGELGGIRKEMAVGFISGTSDRTEENHKKNRNQNSLFSPPSSGPPTAIQKS